MTELVERAQHGDAAAFADLVQPYRHELLVHCYRMLGSLDDAEDALQEALLSAWQGLPGFEGRASLRTWLYRVTTNRCVDALRAAGRRTPDMGATISGIEPPRPTRVSEVPWLQPLPDVLLEATADAAPGPEVVVERQEAVSLAFVTALQLLPPRQRAVLILRDVLGYRAAEVAALLDATEESVTSALKRARATLAARLRDRREHEPPPRPGSARERALVERFMAAFRIHDVPAIIELLTEDAWIAMPPMPFEYQGREAAARFFEAIAAATGPERRFLETRANGQVALAVYVEDRSSGVWRSNGLIVVTMAGDLISDLVRFEPAVLGAFGLPRMLPELA